MGLRENGFWVRRDMQAKLAECGSGPAEMRRPTNAVSWAKTIKTNGQGEDEAMQQNDEC